MHIYIRIITLQMQEAVHLSLFRRVCLLLQRTATHCNTTQHTATHCNTLQDTARHCKTLQRTALLLTPCRTVEDLFVTFVFLSRSHWFDPSMCTRVFVSKKLSMMQVFLIFLVLEESLNCTSETWNFVTWNFVKFQVSPVKIACLTSHEIPCLKRHEIVA